MEARVQGVAFHPAEGGDDAGIAGGHLGGAGHVEQDAQDHGRDHDDQGFIEFHGSNLPLVSSVSLKRCDSSRYGIARPLGNEYSIAKTRRFRKCPAGRDRALTCGGPAGKRKNAHISAKIDRLLI